MGGQKLLYGLILNLSCLRDFRESIIDVSFYLIYSFDLFLQLIIDDFHSILISDLFDYLRKFNDLRFLIKVLLHKIIVEPLVFGYLLLVAIVIVLQ